MSEIWKTAPGFEGVLQVSSDGHVRSLPRVVDAIRKGVAMRQARPGKVLSPFIARNGYPTISLMRAGVRKKYTVHRLVAAAFCEGHAEGLTVNHINGVKADNRAVNLEWVSLARNTELQWRDGLVDLRGEAHPDAKLTARKVRIIRRLLALGAACNEIGELAEITPTIIYRIRDGAAWQSVV
jgi:hypothetical protein